MDDEPGGRMSLNLYDEVSFKDTAVAKDSKAEMEVEITGFITGIKLKAGADKVYKKYRISENKPRRYSSPKHYGWKKEKALTLITNSREDE